MDSLSGVRPQHVGIREAIVQPNTTDVGLVLCTFGLWPPARVDRVGTAPI